MRIQNLVIICVICLTLINTVFASTPTLKDINQIEKDKTIIENDLAYIATNEAVISVDNFKAISGDKVNLNLDSNIKIDSVCFDFPIPVDKFNIKEIKKSVFLLVDENLKGNEQKTEYSICYENLNLKKDNIYFDLHYSGYGEIKYNITINKEIILDPYIIGDLSVSPYLVLHLPFDNSINILFASKTNIFNVSNTRVNITKITNSCSNLANCAQTADESYSTSGYIYSTGTPAQSGSILHEFTKATTDTGAILQYKCEGSGTSGNGIQTVNISIPQSCFNAYTNKIAVFYTINNVVGYYVNYLYLTLYCDNGVTYEDITPINCMANSNGNSVTLAFYEDSIYLTNQSNFSTYDNTIPATAYINTYSLVAGFPFNVMNNSNDVSGNAKNGVPINITYNSSGAYFNASKLSYIDVSGLYNIYNGSQIKNMTLFTRFKMNSIPSGTYNLAGWWYSKTNTIKVSSNSKVYSTVTTTDGTFSSGESLVFGINEWHTAALRTNSTHVCIFLDGLQSNCGAATGYINTSTDTFNIGNIQNGSTGLTYQFNGTIQEVLFYNRSLSNQEIAKLHNNGKFDLNKLNETNTSIILSKNESILIANNTDLASKNSYSLSVWFKSTNYSNGDIIYGDYDNLGTNAGLAVGLQNGFAAYYTTNGGWLTGDINITDNLWHNIIITQNANNKTIYIDGTLDTTGSGNATANTKIKSIGSPYPYANNYLNGSIDELLLYSYVLDSTSISILANGYRSALNFSFYDEATNDPVTTLVTITLFNDTFSRTYTTQQGNLFINDIDPGNYSGTFSAVNYTSKQYVTIVSNVDQLNNYAIYLTNTTDSLTTIFTLIDQDTSQTLQNVLITDYRMINNNWTAIESKYSDVTGKAQFTYLAGVNYKFLISKPGYNTYLFYLNPILFSTYTIAMNKTVLINYTYDFDQVSLTFSSGPFNNNANNTFNFIIGSPNSNLISYGFNLTYPGGTNSTNGTNPTGSQISRNFTITNATVFDNVRVDYYYQTNLSGIRTYTAFLPINVNITGENTIESNRTKTYGLGLFERLIIFTLIIFIVMGLGALTGLIIPSVGLDIFLSAYLAYIGFIEIWLALPMIFILVLYIIWKSGQQ